jgi:hypothetical protein
MAARTSFRGLAGIVGRLGLGLLAAAGLALGTLLPARAQQEAPDPAPPMQTTQMAPAPKPAAVAAEPNKAKEVAQTEADTWLKAGEGSRELISGQPNKLGTAVLLAATVVLALVCVALLLAIFRGKSVQLVTQLLSEGGTAGEPGKASISRLQMILWNFVVAFAFLYVLATRLNVQAAIGSLLQGPVLALLGISNGTYLLGKVATPKAPPASDGGDAGDRGGQPVQPGESAAPGAQGTQ